MVNVDLPYELWRPIFQDVYATQNQISHPPSDFVFSKLHSRLNVYRCLASVSKSWRPHARDVFLEDLHVHTTEALRGLLVLFKSNRQLALAVSRLDFSFSEFRCSISTPRRPRPLAPDPEPAPGSTSPTQRRHHLPPYRIPRNFAPRQASSSHSPLSVPDWKSIHRRDAQLYTPSSTRQANHWTIWQNDVADLLSMCSSTSEVIISFTSSSDYYSRPRMSHNAVEYWFPPPDLTNGRIAEGLLKSTNLRSLTLIDPAPLRVFGPAFNQWERLKSLNITLTRTFKELPTITFIPPKSLHFMRFHDTTPAKYSWPLSSDMCNCTNLQALDLGLAYGNVDTLKAITFLCKTYEHTLRALILRDFQGDGNVRFSNLFQSDALPSPFHFTNLERLHLPNAPYDTSLFASFKADKLKLVEVGWLTIEPGITGTREEKWTRGLTSHSSLHLLKMLIINSPDPDDMRKNALMSVCERLGITLKMGYSMVGSTTGAIDDVFDIDFEQSVV